MSLADRCVFVRNVQPEDVTVLQKKCLSLNLENIFSKDEHAYLVFPDQESAITAVRDLRQVKLEDSEEFLNVVLLPQGQASIVSELIATAAKTDTENKSSSEESKKPDVLQQIMELLGSMTDQERKQVSGFLEGASSSASPGGSTAEHLAASASESSLHGVRSPQMDHGLPVPHQPPPPTSNVSQPNYIWSQPPGVLRLSAQFSGELSNKSDVSYEIWRQEVMSLIESGGYSDIAMVLAMKKSLKGLAAQVLLYMDPHATAIAHVRKLDSVFGNVLPIETLQERFWSARQNSGESVAAWSCRLQHLALLISSRDPTVFPPDDKSRLRTKFWSGLYEEKMRMELRHLIDSGASYEEVLVEARILETQRSQRVSSRQTEAAVEESTLKSAEKKSLDHVLSILQKMETRLTAVEQRGSAPAATSSGPQKGFRGICFKCKQYGHKKADCPLNF